MTATHCSRTSWLSWAEIAAFAFATGACGELGQPSPNESARASAQQHASSGNDTPVLLGCDRKSSVMHDLARMAATPGWTVALVKRIGSPVTKLLSRANGGRLSVGADETWVTTRFIVERPFSTAEPALAPGTELEGAWLERVLHKDTSGATVSEQKEPPPPALTDTSETVQFLAVLGPVPAMEKRRRLVRAYATADGRFVDPPPGLKAGDAVEAALVPHSETEPQP